MKTRIFRDNKELPWIEDYQHYDFKLQILRKLNPYYTILPGDQLTVECVFDTTDRNKTTFVCKKLKYKNTTKEKNKYN